MTNTGGLQVWQSVTTSITPTTGKHTLLLRFVSAKDPEFVHTNWFAFKGPEVGQCQRSAPVVW